MSDTATATKPGEMRTARLAEDLVRMAIVVAQHREITVGDLLDPVIRPWLTDAYRQAGKEMMAFGTPELGEAGA